MSKKAIEVQTNLKDRVCIKMPEMLVSGPKKEKLLLNLFLFACSLEWANRSRNLKMKRKRLLIYTTSRHMNLLQHRLGKVNGQTVFH